MTPGCSGTTGAKWWKPGRTSQVTQVMFNYRGLNAGINVGAFTLNMGFLGGIELNYLGL